LNECGRPTSSQEESSKVVASAPVTSARLNFQPWLKFWTRRVPALPDDPAAPGCPAAPAAPPAPPAATPPLPPRPAAPVPPPADVWPASVEPPAPGDPPPAPSVPPRDPGCPPVCPPDPDECPPLPAPTPCPPPPQPMWGDTTSRPRTRAATLFASELRRKKVGAEACGMQNTAGRPGVVERILPAVVRVATVVPVVKAPLALFVPLMDFRPAHLTRWRSAPPPPLRVSRWAVRPDHAPTRRRRQEDRQPQES